ncbi:hypothetical protein GCM10010435_70160 [Winogradskya consettensis]|uniref:TIR domain-containing protein n=2 Tax=Winogradskya consettensis TaxID=113560 RepID=A0A919SQ86_9ACTN|nr:hypothetical protein Aco04nite_45950 [Actinoplanes consettensis]
MPDDTRFHVFISYAHRRDQELAATLQREIRRFGVPFYRHQPVFPTAPAGARRRPLRVFRDATNLPAAPSLPQQLVEAINASHWLLLMASPDSAASSWVRQEVGLWLAKDPAATRVLIALTDGRIATTVDNQRIDPELTDALPPDLVAALRHVPLWTDLRTVRGPVESGAGRRRRIGDVVADFAAPIQGVDKDTLVGEHLRQQRRTLRAALGATALVTTLALVASALAVVAFRARGEAVRQRDTALANQLVAEAATITDTQPGLARQMLAAASRISRTPQVAGALAAGRSIPQEVRVDAELAAFSTDGGVLALARSGNDEYTTLGTTHPATDGVIRLLGTKSLTEAGTIPLGHGISQGIVFLPGERRRIAAGYDTAVRIWDVQDPSHPRELPSLAGHRDVVDLLATGAAGLVATVDWKHELRMWDVADPAAPRLLSATALPMLEERSYSRLAFAPGARRLVFSDVSRGPAFVDVSDPAKPRVLPLVPALGDVQSFAYAPEGGWALSGGRESPARRWRVGPTGAVASPAALPVADPGAQVLEAATGPQGQLAAVTEDGNVQVWNNGLDDDVPPLVATFLVPEFDANNTDAFGFSPSGRQLMMLSPGTNTGPGGAGRQDDSTLRIWQLADGRQPGAVSARPGGTIAVHENVLASVSGDTLALWDVRQEGPPLPLGSLPAGASVEVLAFNPDGSRLAILSGNRLVTVDTKDPGRPAKSGEWTIAGLPDVCVEGKECAAWSVAFVDDHVLAIGDSSRQITLVDTTGPSGGAPLGTIVAHYGSVTNLDVLHPPGGGPVLVSGGLNSPAAELWDVSDPARAELIAPVCAGGTFTRDDTGARCAGGYSLLDLATDRGGRLMAAADRAGTVRVWRLGDGELQVLATMQDTGDVYEVAMSPDGARVATIGRDRTLRYYRIAARTVTLEGVVHIGPGAGRSLAFAGDDHTLVAAMEHGLADVWELDPGINSRALCAGSGERITRAQWERDIPGLPYEPPC